MRLLAVDLDGTLVDSAPDLAYCVDRALAGAGFAPAGEARVRGWIGDGIERLLERALATALAAAGPSADAGARDAAAAPVPPALLERCLADFDACYRRHTFERGRVYPRVPETLDALRASGIGLSCVTNKRHAFAERLLEQAGLRDRFGLVLGGDSLPAKKPDAAQLIEAAARFGVSAADTVMVGDSHHDRDAARRAGCRFVWARYGYCPSLDRHAGGTEAVEPTAGPVDAIDGFDGLLALLRDP